MTDKRLPLIGRDLMLARDVARPAFDALRVRHDYTSMRQTSFGYSFTVEGEQGRVYRVTVEQEPWAGAEGRADG